MQTPSTNGSTDDETDTPTTLTPTSVGTALVRAKELRDQGNGEEAESLLKSFFSAQEAAKEEAKKQAHIAVTNLSRLAGKKERHAKTHVEKTIPRPWDDPIFLKHCRGKTLTAALMTTLGKVAISEAGADFGPVPDGFRGVPQKGSYSPPRVVIASWIESQIRATSNDIEVAADIAGLRLERKIDHLMLTHREYVVRCWHIVAYMMLLAKMGGDETATQAAMEKDFEWLTSYDPKAVLVGADEPTAGGGANTPVAPEGGDDDAGAEPGCAGASTATLDATMSTDDEAEPDSDSDLSGAHVGESEVTSP